MKRLLTLTLIASAFALTSVAPVLAADQMGGSAAPAAGAMDNAMAPAAKTAPKAKKAKKMKTTKSKKAKKAAAPAAQ